MCTRSARRCASARRVAEAQSRAKTHRAGRHHLYVIGRTPAQVFDAGTHYMVSGYNEASVREAVQKLAERGGKLISEVSKVGAKWLASVEQPARRRREGGGVRLQARNLGADARGGQVKVRELLEMGAYPGAGGGARRRRVDRGVREDLKRSYFSFSCTSISSMPRGSRAAWLTVWARSR